MDEPVVLPRRGRGRRLKDVKTVVRAKNRPTKVLTIDAVTAKAIRKVAREDGLRMTDFLDEALKAYLAVHHPDWPLTYESVET